MTEESWLPTLKTETPEEGYKLAVKLARKAVGMTQPDENVRKKLRPVYANNADSLTLLPKSWPFIFKQWQQPIITGMIDSMQRDP